MAVHHERLVAMGRVDEHNGRDEEFEEDEEEDGEDSDDD
jgi:hypothetical protein